MNTVFPAGFPAATALYLSLYVGSLVLHVLLMSYVLAGSLLLLGRALVGAASRRRRPVELVEAVLRDWLPFFLGAAITAGVAPLLFLQVLYRESFYTANLLLLHRWMGLLPALIIAFYLLYVMKTAWFAAAGPVARVGLSAVAYGLFVFVAWSWTENHLLALAGRDTWVPFYVDRRIFFTHPALLPRLGLWLSGAVPAMATIAATQLALLRRRRLRHPDDPPSEAQALAVTDNLRLEAARLPRLAAAALVVAGACALGYPLQTAAAIVWGPLCRVYVLAGSVGLLVHSAGWWWMHHSRRIDGAVLTALWTGLLATIIAVAVVRETVRLNQLDITTLYAQHARAATVGGGGAFALFATLNAILIGWCLWQATRTREGSQARYARAKEGVA